MIVAKLVDTMIDGLNEAELDIVNSGVSGHWDGEEIDIKK